MRLSVNTMSSTAVLNRSTGTAKPMPALESDVFTMAVLMPTSLQFLSKRDYIEFTGLMVTSICMHPIIMPSSAGEEGQIWYGWQASTMKRIEGTLTKTFTMMMTTLNMTLMKKGPLSHDVIGNVWNEINCISVPLFQYQWHIVGYLRDGKVGHFVYVLVIDESWSSTYRYAPGRMTTTFWSCCSWLPPLLPIPANVLLLTPTLHPSILIRYGRGRTYRFTM